MFAHHSEHTIDLPNANASADVSHANHHAHGDHHHHHHHHVTPGNGKKLFWVTFLNALITIVEFVGGIISGSLSLVSDAVHNLGDTLAIAFAWAAQGIGAKKASMRYTFGYKRAEILAAFLNATVLMAICFFLLKEAYDKWMNPSTIDGTLMLTVAIIGLFANLFCVLILQKDKEHNINTRAAYLHLLGDTMSSVAVILGAIAIMLRGAFWLDPLITVFVSIYIMYHTWGVLKEAIDILMQSAPADIDLSEIVKEVEAVAGVSNIHHLHVWQLSEEQTHFEAHILTSPGTSVETMAEIRRQVNEILERHGIHHSTLQIETDSSCGSCDQLIVDEGH